MALNPAGLTLQLTSILQAFLPSGALVAQQFAMAYTAYAQQGQFGTGMPVILPSNTAALQASLLPALATPLGTPATLAAAWAQGVFAFWSSPPPAVVPIPVIGVQAGVVTVPPIGALAMTPALTAVFANLANTAPVTAATMVAVIHPASLTTMATVVPPPGTVVPLL